MKSAKPLTAKQRTINMPGVDVGERPNYAAPMVDMCGPHLARRVCVTETGTETHLVDSAGVPVCGTPIRYIDRHGYKTLACAACRIEASRLRATVAL